MADTKVAPFGGPSPFEHRNAFNFSDFHTMSKESSLGFQFKAGLATLDKPRRRQKRSTSCQSAHPIVHKNSFSSHTGNNSGKCGGGGIVVNWGDIPHDAMSLIVRFIEEDEILSKTTLQNMRLVNKDWCAAVGMSIQELRCELDCEGVSIRIDNVFPNLTSLTSTRTTDAGLAGIGCLKNLKILGLVSHELESEGLSNLTGLTRLTELRLECPQMGRHGLKYLSSLSRLASLDLSGLPISGNRMVDVAGLKNLVSLKLGPMKELRIAHGKDLSSLARKRLCH